MTETLRFVPLVAGEEAQAKRREEAKRENAKSPHYGECGHRLALDNTGPLCSPCARRYKDENPHDKIPQPNFDEVPVWKRPSDYEPVKGGPRSGMRFLPGLRRERERAGIPVEDLARKLRVNWAYVEEWQGQTRRCTVEGMDAIAEVLGCTPADLRRIF
jgi:hypothetical protein